MIQIIGGISARVESTGLFCGFFSPCETSVSQDALVSYFGKQF